MCIRDRPRTQSGRKYLAVYARQLALEPRLQILRRYRRSLLLRLEYARRSPLENHVHRTTPVGTWVLINEMWYKTTLGRLGARTIAPIRIAFRQRNDVGTQDEGTFAAQWLAYALPCQRFANTLAGICA